MKTLIRFLTRKKVDKFGRVALGFSTPLEPISFFSIIDRLTFSGKLTEKGKRKLENDIQKNDGTEEGNIELSETEKIEKIIKETKSITLELVPGNAINA